MAFDASSQDLSKTLEKSVTLRYDYDFSASVTFVTVNIFQLPPILLLVNYSKNISRLSICQIEFLI